MSGRVCQQPPQPPSAKTQLMPRSEEAPPTAGAGTAGVWWGEKGQALESLWHRLGTSHRARDPESRCKQQTPVSNARDAQGGPWALSRSLATGDPAGSVSLAYVHCLLRLCPAPVPGCCPCSVPRKPRGMPATAFPQLLSWVLGCQLCWNPAGPPARAGEQGPPGAPLCPTQAPHCLPLHPCHSQPAPSGPPVGHASTFLLSQLPQGPLLCSEPALPLLCRPCHISCGHAHRPQISSALDSRGAWVLVPQLLGRAPGMLGPGHPLRLLRLLPACLHCNPNPG